MKMLKNVIAKKLLTSLLVVSFLPISGLTMTQAAATAAQPTSIPCGGGAGSPHFSVGSYRKGNWEIHAQASNWCNQQPNELALGGMMFRSSWRGWIEEPHIGESKNPEVRSNKSGSSPNKFVLVVECEPNTWYRWRARFGNSATINGKPAGNANPIMLTETKEEIPCAPQ